MSMTRSTRLGALLVAVGAVLALSIAGCGSSDSSSSGTTTTAASASGGSGGSGEKAYVSGAEITDAEAWRDDLLAIAQTSFDKANKKSMSGGIAEGWQAAYPTVLTKGQIVGSAIAPPKNGISGFALVVDKATNGDVLVFRAADNQGNCAAGEVMVAPDGAVTTKTLDGPGACDTPK